ncbi:hypothetical protein [Fonticella tunisiensis]|uniref:Uncharacterized protein n=1 Tax=Fonticella tunisiensis TaxID=1096341 RepID=A0A4R7KD48_9CLOT|nr:hypothetical protein [Fonticella tunisiensis]TDT51875.1 hypothetical protein EDD71_11710 [Fonticella tunisiensis]
MWEKFLYILFLMLLLLGSVKFTRIMMKRFKLNRWIIGFSAFLVLIIPNIIFDEIHPAIWYGLSIIFAVLCIMFFEITRTMLEKDEYKGLVKYDMKRK